LKLGCGVAWAGEPKDLGISRIRTHNNDKFI